MARNRTPSAILDAKGSFLTHKDRVRSNEPVTGEPIGPPPKWLSAAEKRVWKELVKQSAPGVLMASDREAFELLVKLATKKRYHFDQMMVGEISQFISLASRFAMTPSDRSKVVVDKPKESQLGQFLARRSQAPVPPKVVSIA
jgi:phage terminase small subunit